MLLLWSSWLSDDLLFIIFWSLGWKCSVGSLLLPWMEFPHLSSPSHSHLLSGNNMCGLCQAGGSSCSFPYCCCSYVNSSEPPHTPYLETCSLVASRNSQNYSPAPCSLSKKVLSRSPACPLFKRFLLSDTRQLPSHSLWASPHFKCNQDLWSTLIILIILSGSW